MTPAAPLRFVIYSRLDCGLCEEMLHALTALRAARAIPIEVVDVDSNQEAQRRYGHKIPVLLYAEEMVCHGRLDASEVHKALAHHGRPVY